ncbi:hypothetical protein ACQEVG_37345 [Streptomyces sp. CA-135486]|uniref:hypothetical protein n=1 Tax=Streptomyces sp. CA-135486 TaxID=3240049 RepID=UPI003D8C352C
MKALASLLAGRRLRRLEPWGLAALRLSDAFDLHAGDRVEDSRVGSAVVVGVDVDVDGQDDRPGLGDDGGLQEFSMTQPWAAKAWSAPVTTPPWYCVFLRANRSIASAVLV